MKRAVARILPPRDLGSNLGGLNLDINSIGDFYITLDNPHRTWSPGDEVSGQIILGTKKNLVNVVVMLSLVGMIKVNSSSHKLRPLKQSLFTHTIRIYGEENGDSGLFKGEHRFPFIVTLPVKRIFTSIEFGKGSITYTLRAAVATASQVSTPACTADKVLNILKPIDVSLLPVAKPKKLIIRDPRHSRFLKRTHSVNSSMTMSTTSSTESSAPDTGGESPSSIRLSLEIPQRGFIRGEMIPIRIQINHFRKLSDVNGIIITFVRVCRLNNAEEGFLESFRKDLQQAVLPLYVDPETNQAVVTTNIRVPPDAFPTIEKCPLVAFSYYIEALVNLSGKSVELTSQLTNGDPKSPSVEGKEFTGRSSFVDTDKYKRSRRFLQLTSEVIIGTHRSVPTDGVSPWSEVPMSPQVMTSPPSDSPMPSVAEAPGTSPYQSPVPEYEEAPVAVPYHHHATTAVGDDKQLLQAQEAALLPSAPPDSDDETEYPSLPEYQGNPTAGGDNRE